MSWMSGPMFPPVNGSSSVPSGPDDIAGPADDDEPADDEPSSREPQE